MERLIVKNFLAVEEADLEVAKFTVIIGPQASGKSVLAKLLYFFREFLMSSLGGALFRPFDKKLTEQEMAESFSNYFPTYTWGTRSFEVAYKTTTFETKITRQADVNGIEIDLTYSVELEKMLSDLFAQNMEKLGSGPLKPLVTGAAREKFLKQIASLVVGAAKPVFIPAGRSFLSILQGNMFKLLREDVVLDPFMWDFGASLETIRRSRGEESLMDDGKAVDADVQKLTESILVGKYRFDEDRDWIDNDGRSVGLIHASSGQQEALPMLLMLSSPQHRGNGTLITIEEPEAHLFPDSQKNIVRLLALLQRRYQTRFLVTTHSPYILTALNNLIIAGDVWKNIDEDVARGAVDPDYLFEYEDVRAYTIQSGRLSSIKDDESRLIGVNVIDSVSDDFAEEFDALLRLKYSGSNT